MFSKSSKVFMRVLLLTLLTPLSASMVFSKSNFDNNTNEVPTISSSNENDYQPILVDYYTNIINP